MASPESNIGKWVKLGWDDKSGAIVAMAKLITELGKTNPDYATFAPEWFPWYGATTNVAWGKMVDPDLLEPYVDAWIRFAFKNKRTFTAAQAKAAMVGAGLDNTRSYVVANAMWRLDQAGKLPDIIKSPAGWAASTGLGVTDAAKAVEDLLKGLTGIVRWLPWIAVGVAAFVAWPYIAAARTPGKLLGGAR